MNIPCARYLRTVREAGLFAEHQGRHYVAGLQVDPLTGRPRIVIEYADPDLLSDGPTMSVLLGALHAQYPQAHDAVVRTSAAVQLPAPWRPLLTYVQLAAVATPPDPRVIEALPEHDSLVRDWLIQAFVAACQINDDPVSLASAAEAADLILADPGRVSMLYRDGSGAIGHATMLVDSVDEVTGEASVELFDALVEPGSEQRRALRALVAACATRAANAGRALLGNVVHSYTGPDPAEAVLASLAVMGWIPAQRYWRCGVW